MNAKTFLTSLKDNGQHERQNSGLQRVKGLHSQLRDVVGSLNSKVASVLQKQEQDFLAAYRAHMYNVQKELQTLRAKVDEAELEMKKNDKIRKLESERDWYRKEALRLDGFTTTIQKELQFMKEKLESIEDDRSWLEKQLKTSKKQNKLLKAELEIRLSKIGNEDEIETVATESVHRNPSVGNLGRLPSFRRQSMNNNNNNGVFEDEDVVPTEKLKEMEARYSNTIRGLKRLLATERKSVRQLRATVVGNATKTATLEEFFLRSIEEVKKEVARRRAKSNARSASVRPGSSNNSMFPSPRGSKRRTKSRMVRKQTPSPEEMDPALESFTPYDRRAVVYRLLQNEEVISFLYENLFPGPGGPTSAFSGGGEQPPLVSNSQSPQQQVAFEEEEFDETASQDSTLEDTYQGFSQKFK